MIDMIWRGDKVHNFGPRIRNGKTFTPMAIVSHISAGTMGSMQNWFQNPASQASSHFAIRRDGQIHQYVRIDHAAWTQGLTTEAIPLAVSQLVRQMGVNPNLYCVSIEHEGYAEGHKDAAGEVVLEYLGLKGDITEEQFWSSCWLHKYIQQEVEREWGHHIQLAPQFVLGHFQIDPRRKPFCPGPLFPWPRRNAELAIAESMPFAVYEERIHYHRSGGGDYAKAYQTAERARDLANKLASKEWAKTATEQLLALAPVVPGMKTAKQIASRILELHGKFVDGGKWAPEALRKLLIVYAHMKQTGLL